MTEAELLRTAARLGEHVVEQLDETRLATAVLNRLATEPVVAARPLYRRMWVLGLAAAAAMLLVLRLSLPGSAHPDRSTALGSPTSTVLHELDDLTAAELEAVLETLPPPASVTEHPESPSLESLDAKSLEQLLRSLEG